MYLCSTWYWIIEKPQRSLQKGMEEEIVNIALDTRVDKAKERQDHSMAQQVQQGEQIGEREGDLWKEEIAEPNENMDDGIAENVVQDET